MCSPAGYRSAMPVRLTLTGSNLVDLEPCPKDSKRLESAWICIQSSLQEYGSLRHGSRPTCSPEPAVGSFTGSLSLSLSLLLSLSTILLIPGSGCLPSPGCAQPTQRMRLQSAFLMPKLQWTEKKNVHASWCFACFVSVVDCVAMMRTAC